MITKSEVIPDVNFVLGVQFPAGTVVHCAQQMGTRQLIQPNGLITGHEVTSWTVLYSLPDEYKDWQAMAPHGKVWLEPTKTWMDEPARAYGVAVTPPHPRG